MKGQRLMLYVILLMIVIGSLLIYVILHNFWPDWQWIYEPLHSTMEAVGNLAAIIMAILLFERKHEMYNGKFFLIAIGFLGMGLLGGFHAVSSLGRGFVLLYNMANLVGGFWFAMILTPWFSTNKEATWKKWIPWVFGLGCIFFGIWTLVARETLPMMVKNGKFTITAVSINLLAGLFFLAGAGRLLLDFHRSQKMEFYLIACMATFLGMTGLMFKYSSIWSSTWWFWHFLRLTALLLVLKYLFYESRRRISDLRLALVEQKKAEENLSESEKKYRGLVDNALVGVYKSNLKGDILYVNKALLSILEFETAEELMANGALARYKNPKDREILIENLKKTGRVINFEVELFTKPGRPKNMLLSATLVGDQLSGMVIDITDRKQAEKALQVTYHFLEIANRHREMPSLLKEFVAEVKKLTGCNAVGIRILDKEGNIPYQAYEGFSRRFYESESPLSIKSDQCMCINVVKGVVDQKPSYYTKGGSFYMNGTTRFLNTLSEKEKRQTRNACNQFGYESVALVPIRIEDCILGLIHIADPKENMVPLEILEGLEKVAMQLGTAIQRVQVEAALDRQRDELTAHAHILSAILVTKDFNERLKIILNEVMTFLNVEFGTIHLLVADEVVLTQWHGVSNEFRAQVLSFPAKKLPDFLGGLSIIHEHLDERGLMPELAKQENLQAWASIPLTLPQRGVDQPAVGLGTIILGSRRYEALRVDEVKVFEAIANQLALAIDYARSYRQAEERMARLQALRDIDKAIMQRFDLKEVLHIVLERVPKELGADAAAISLLDEKQSKTEVFVMRLPNGTVIEEEAFTLADSLLHWFVNRQNPVIIYDLTQDPRVQMHRVYIRNGRLISYLGVPLIVKDKTIGILHILATQPKVFADEDVGFFSTMAGQTAIAIENARATEALRETRDYLDNLFNYANAPIIVWDSMSKITRFNHAFEHLSGYTAEEVIGQDLHMLFPKASRKESLEEIGHTLKGEYWESVEIPILRKDGEIRIALWNSANIITEDGTTVIATIAQGQDITQRKRTEEALERLGNQTKLILDSVGEGIYGVDLQGNTTFVNPTAMRLSGYKDEELIGRNLHKIIHHTRPDGTPYPNEECQICWTLKDGKIHHITDEVFWRKDGTSFPVEYTASPIIEQGRITGAVVTVKDITEHKRAEEEKTALQEQLRQSQKMEAIGHLAGGIAHDFNNLLTVIKGYSQLSLPELKEGDPLKGNIEEIQRSADRAADLTRQLLAFSRRQILDLKVLDLNTILHNLDKMLRRIISEDIELVTVLPEELGRVKIDPGQIEQVIMNLAVNARDAMPKGGKLTIETANLELDEVYARNHIAVTPGRYVMLSVSDTGVGMTPEVRDRVFEPFFTTKEKDKGTGLGLSTVYGIVKQSGGNIWVYSELGQGTTFKIYLPRVDEPLEVWGEKVVEEIPRGNETILIVEDEEAVRKLAMRILERQGYTVFEAHDVDEALQICEDMKEPIHLILTDVVMPQLSGRQLVEQISQVRQDFKVLYMSGYADNAIVHHGVLEKGMNFIQKPFTLEGLARKIREVLDK